MRIPLAKFGIIFAGIILLTACGGDAATATPSPTPSPAATATPSLTPSPVATVAPTAVPATPMVAESTPASAESTSEQQPLTAELLARFGNSVEDTREHYNVPGMAVVVVQNGVVAFAQGFGVKKLALMTRLRRILYSVSAQQPRR